jgi:hypothetical protein
VSKYEKKITINVLQHDDRLRYLRPFYNGAFSIAAKYDFDDQFFFCDSIQGVSAKTFEPNISAQGREGRGFNSDPGRN